VPSAASVAGPVPARDLSPEGIVGLGVVGHSAAAGACRLVRRYDRKPEHFQAFADLSCALLCYRRLLKNNHLG
jgi:hypothetical protein